MAATLKPEWELFVNEYLVDLNATRAAQRAGFGSDERSASTYGLRLLGKVVIRRAIRKAFNARLKRVKMTADDVIRELEIVALSDVLNYEVNDKTGRLVPLRNRNASKAVSSVKIKKTYRLDGSIDECTTEFRLWDKLKAAELLMKHMGLLDDDKSSRSGGATGAGLTERASRILEQRRSSLN